MSPGAALAEAPALADRLMDDANSIQPLIDKR